MSILEAMCLFCRRFFSSAQGTLTSLLQIQYHLFLTLLFWLIPVLTLCCHRIANLHIAAKIARKIISPLAVILFLCLFVCCLCFWFSLVALEFFPVLVIHKYCFLKQQIFFQTWKSHWFSTDVFSPIPEQCSE